MQPANHGCCIFCGGQIVRRYNRSAVSLGAVQDFLGRYCVKTGHHYAVIAGMSGREQIVGVCLVCRGWQRRVTQRTVKKQGIRSNLTPIDHIIKVVLSPGSAADLDQRNWHFIAKTILDQANLFSDVIPTPVRTILSDMLKSDPSSDHRSVLAKAWYKYNQKPVFFNNGKLASIMKRFTSD